MADAKPIEIQPGEAAIAEEPVTIAAVARGEVLVCLFAPEGAPKKGGGALHLVDSSVSLPLIGKLAREIAGACGLAPGELCAKLAGGAGTEGLRMVESIDAELRSLGIPIVGRSTGGAAAREIRFEPITGRLRVAELDSPETRVEASVARKLRVLVVDDSKTIVEMLTGMIRQDPFLEVVGEASDGLEAIALLDRVKADVMTLDLQMPRMGGVELLRRTPADRRPPAVVVSSIAKEEGSLVLDALEAGAFDYVRKPALADLPAIGARLRETLKAAARANHAGSRYTVPTPVPAVANPEAIIVALGASTGGPEAVRRVLSALPKAFPPIVVALHMPPVFSRAFADRLAASCQILVHEAEDGELLVPGEALIAPGGRQLEIARHFDQWKARVFDGPKISGHRPSVDVLFSSVARKCGDRSIGILMTGMGADGARGLKDMRDSGAITGVQDEASSVVFGMPREAIRLGAASEQVPLDRIASWIAEAARRRIRERLTLPKAG